MDGNKRDALAVGLVVGATLLSIWHLESNQRTPEDFAAYVHTGKGFSCKTIDSTGYGTALEVKTTIGDSTFVYEARGPEGPILRAAETVGHNTSRIAVTHEHFQPTVARCRKENAPE